jgi:acetolactate decarboxylase
MPPKRPKVDEFSTWARRIIAAHRLSARPDTGEVYQTSTISALLAGVYDGDTTVSELLTHGDFGLGTFNGLDGEMVVLHGICYQLRADGSATRARPDSPTPFAAVTHFHADSTLHIETATTRPDVLHAIDGIINSHNLIHAIHVTGTFAHVRTRTVAAQTKPYPPLTQASDEQAEQDFTTTRGDIVGFLTPDFEQGISVSGYHLHFLDETRARGGHVLDFTLHHGKINVSTASELHLRLPTTGPFLDAQLATEDLDEQIHHAEGAGD